MLSKEGKYVASKILLNKDHICFFMQNLENKAKYEVQEKKKNFNYLWSFKFKNGMYLILIFGKSR